MKQMRMFAVCVGGEFESGQGEHPWTSDIGSARPLTRDEVGERAQAHFANGERDVAAVPVPSHLVVPQPRDDVGNRTAPFGGRELLLVRLSHGTKLAVQVDVAVRPSRGNKLRVWAWKANSNEWTNAQTIDVADVIGPADPKDRRIKKAAAEWKPDGSGPVPRRRPAG